MKLSASDEAKLKKVHPDLVKVIRKAAETTTIPFKIMETARSVEQQKKNIARGVSWTMNSRHIVSKDGLCRAADCVPIDEKGKPIWAWPVYHKMRPMWLAAAKAVGVPIELGMDWKKTPDGPHIQLPRRVYP